MATYAVNQTKSPSPIDGSNPSRAKSDLKPMSREEYASAIRRLIDSVDDFIEDEVSPQREKAWYYYNGNTYLNEPPKGRSKVVMSEVRDVVEATMPSLMRIFLSTENIVEFLPTTEEAVPEQEQKTAYVNHVFMRENNGWRLLHDFCKDALVAKVGCFKSYWQDEFDITDHYYVGLDEQEYELLLSDPEISAAEEPTVSEDGFYSCHLQRKKNNGKICVETVPSEEFVIDREAKTPEDAHIIGQRTERTVAELVQMGFKYDTVAALATDSSSESEIQHERQAKTSYTRDEHELSEVQIQMRTIEVWDVNVRIDKDGDGLTEWRHVIAAGRSSAVNILLDEPIDPCGIMFTPASPVMLPNTVIGKSQADFLFDLQEIVTHIVRQMLDNLTNVNNPRLEVVENQVSMMDLLDNRHRGTIRVRAPGMIRELETAYVADKCMPVLDFLEHKQEMRVGVSKASMGLDADALQSSTEIGVRKVLGAAEQKIQMVAATLAHVGLVPLFQRIARLAAQYQDKAKIVRVHGSFVPMDPREWRTDERMIVNVGIGNGSTDDQMASLAAYMEKSEGLLANMGPDNPILDLNHYAHAYRKLVELAGFKDTSKFVNPPQVVQQKFKQMMQAQSQQQDPKAQAEMAKAQADIQKKQQDMQIAQIKAQMDAQVKEAQTAARIELEKWKTEQQVALEEWKTNQELAVERWKVEQQTALDKAEFIVETQLEREKMKAGVQSGQGDIRRRDKE